MIVFYILLCAEILQKVSHRLACKIYVYFSRHHYKTACITFSVFALDVRVYDGAGKT